MTTFSTILKRITTIFKRLTTNLRCRQPVELDDDTVDLFHFELLRAIGRGTYGKVRVVEHKQSGGLYALKYVDKAMCLKNKAATNIVQERQLLEEISHPFIVNMYYAFQDPMNCYFVLDLLLGGSLRFHSMRMGSLGEAAVRFYVAEISSALAYLHQNGICHRDVKPDNILLDLQGHARLTDFNVAIHYSQEKFHSTVAGTMVYMAPEVINRDGYSWQIDYWSLGVTAFECLFFGKRPFADKCKDVEVVIKSITQDELVFPPEADNMCSPAGRAALTALLERDPGKRLGCKSWSRHQGQSQLRGHRWFSDINWEKLDARQLAPPFVPDDTNLNFDNHKLDEIFHDDRRLVNRRRRTSYIPERMAADRLLLEQSFIAYDFEKMPRKPYYPNDEPIVARNRIGFAHYFDSDTRPATPALAGTHQVSSNEILL